MNVKELKPARLTYSSPGHRPGLCRNVLIEPYRGDIECLEHFDPFDEGSISVNALLPSYCIVLASTPLSHRLINIHEMICG